MGKSMENFTEQKNTLGLYDPQFEHDACGIGAVVDIKGRKSHQTVDDALSIVERLEHRAGKDAEGKTGDGVGIMLQISHKFFSKVAEELNISLGNEREYGVGMFFFPQSEHLRAQAMKLFEVVTRKEGLEFLAWRKVPVNPDAVGQKARDCMPAIWQCFIKKPAKVSKGIDFDRKLYPHWARSIERRGFQFICDCKERQHKEALVLRLVPAVWNPLVGERIIPPLIGQRFTSKWPYLAAYQARCERRVVDRFYLFVPVVNRN